MMDVLVNTDAATMSPVAASGCVSGSAVSTPAVGALEAVCAWAGNSGASAASATVVISPARPTKPRPLAAETRTIFAIAISPPLKRTPQAVLSFGLEPGQQAPHDSKVSWNGQRSVSSLPNTALFKAKCCMNCDAASCET